MAKLPEGGRIGNLVALALCDAEPGAKIWVNSESCMYRAVPTGNAASNAIAGPSDPEPISWQPDGALVTTTSGTTYASSSISGIASVTGGAANGVPPYIYGRDAAWVLQYFLSTKPKALHSIGDSRSINLQLHAGKKWTNVPLGGCSAIASVGGAPSPTYYSMNNSSKASNAVRASVAFAGVNYEDYAFRGIDNIAISNSAHSPANNNDNVLQGALVNRADSPLIVNAFDGKTVRCCWPFYLNSLGTVNTRIAVQSWNSSGYAGAPNFVRSAWFATLAAANRLMRKYVVTDATATIGATLISQIVFDNTANVTGEIVSCGMPWFELVDAYGATIHDWALSGSDHEDYVGDSSYRVPNQFPDDVWAAEFRVRGEQHPHMFVIDLGTNGLQIDGIWMDRLAGAATLTRIIERLRRLSNSPNAPVVLRTAYPTSTDQATVWWQQADIDVAAALPNVACIDLYAAVKSVGGYAALNAAGLMADVTHLTNPGREWLETQFNSMLVGGAIVAP